MNCALHIYCMARVYYKSFNYVNFANSNASAKIIASTHFWIHIIIFYVSLAVDTIIKDCE